MSENIKLIQTNDGSFTLWRKDIDETYHSRHGAIQESLHVFIKEGLQYYIQNNPKDAISILEVGFGTGLNAYLTALEGESHTIDYTGLEPLPVSNELINKLCEQDELILNKELYQLLHEAEWETQKEITPSFFLNKVKQELQGYNSQKPFDLIYFDAFGFRAQEEMWTLEILQKIASLCTKGSVFVTYACKGTLKRGLKEVGFDIYKIPGPPGKREMIRAIKK